MVAAAAPSRGSLLGKVGGVLHARSQARKGQPSRVGAFVTDHVGTVTALGFAVTACWHFGDAAGLGATAVAIIVAEFKIRAK